jgi:3-hydroxyacyl-CoA dehydrogenase
MAIAKCAVIGAGLMGGGIAAQIANAGVPVMLLDIVPPKATNRNVIAETAIDRMLRTEPAAFMSPRIARLVTPGNVEDDLPKLNDCDWIVEAVLEKIEVKRATYEKLAKVRKPGAILSSNTSTIPLKDLTSGLPDTFTRDFLITHFFNPPRYMRLLEIVTGPTTDAAAVAAIDDFCDVQLGKHVIHAKDTPGFIANRIGSMWIQAAIQAAFDFGLSVEEADAIMGRPFGMPRTGVFGLLDLVGLDLLPQVAASMQRTLPKADLYLSTMTDRQLLAKMIAEGYTGRKGKGGFYRLQRNAEGSRVREGIDLATGDYRISAAPTLASANERDPTKILAAQDRGGQYARRVLAYTLQYAASLVPAIADTVDDVDQAMKLGYNWTAGPFELIDRIGAANVAAMIAAEKLPLPALLAKPLPFYRVDGGFTRQRTPAGEWVKIGRRPGVLLLGDIKRASQPVAKNASASLWDIGDGVLCVEFHSRKNALDVDSLGMIKTAMDTIKKSAGKYVALVIHNDAENFSAGANVGLVLFAANIALWPMIEDGEATGQKILREMKYASFPTVSAPSGMALGGGCEILLHSSAVQAHAESYIGLVEVGVGLVPGWGGCTEMAARAYSNRQGPQGPIAPLAGIFETIGLAKVSRSAAEARDLMYLRSTDGITMNRDRVLADAKARALALARNYTPPKPLTLRLPGPTGAAAIGLSLNDLHKQGKASDHDLVVAGKLAEVLSGGDTDVTEETSEDQLLALERKAFGTLIRTDQTLARIEHTLETGRPLRN